MPFASARQTARLPLGFLVVALAAMLAVPIIGDRYATPARSEITGLTEPARTQLTHLQLALALEGAAHVEFFETRDSAVLARIRGAHQQEDSAYRSLALMARRLGPEVQRRFDELRDLDTRRHGRAAQLMSSSNTRIAGGDRTLRTLYEGTMVAAAQLDETLNDATQARRDRVLQTERIERRLTIGLGLVALAAIAVVFWIGSRLQLAATQAEQRREALVSALEAREKLMRGVSHDLKNPLNAIDGHAQLIEEGVKGPVTEAQKESLGRIRRAVQTQLSLIVDLVELSRAEAGSLPIHKATTDLCAVVSEIVEEQRPAAEGSAHTLIFLASEPRPVIDTDAERVKQILGNLISNAIKYTPPRGRIAVAVETGEGAGRLAGHRAVAVRVTDTGIGIPRQKTEAVFQEFTRLAPGVAEGAGLGLAIARRIARLLGGDITLASEEGAGSVFTLWLALQGAAGEPARGK